MPDTSNNRTISQISITGAAGAQDLVAAPGVGLRIYVVGFVISLDTAGSLKFTEGTGPTDLTGAMEVLADSPLVVQGCGNVVIRTNTANSKLGLTTATGAPRGWLRYYVAP